MNGRAPSETIAATSDGPPNLFRQEGCSADYVITLSPGNVRYIPNKEFLSADIENVISQVQQLAREEKLESSGISCSYFASVYYDQLFEGELWESRLRLYHAVGRMASNHGAPHGLYYSFHTYLRLGNLCAVDECLESWVKKAHNNKIITDSYRASSEYLVVETEPMESYVTRRPYGGYDEYCYLVKEAALPCVFRKTDFVKRKLLELAQRTEQRTANESLEALSKSRFDSFVYIMEDRRNGTFKIGRSKTPGKRERTLQSEVPEIVLRFSVPAADDHERRLHDRFDPKRLRGEWFNLTEDELLWIVSFLKKNGDVSRISADYEWLGRIALNASSKVGGE
jgi:hypothetical protein